MAACARVEAGRRALRPGVALAAFSSGFLRAAVGSLGPSAGRAASSPLGGQPGPAGGGLRGLPPGAAPAFVFDIDGVLMRGPVVIPAARTALSRLYDAPGEAGRPLVPVAFLTNGGGTSEDARAEQLSSLLGVKVHGHQVVMAHTPMRDLVSEYATTPVMVCGKGTPAQVAKSYGFQRVVSTEQLAHIHPGSTPNSAVTGGAETSLSFDRTLGTREAPIGAVLVMSDPTCWYRDIQLIVDVVSSGGTLLDQPARTVAPRKVPVFIGHDDLLWANDFPRPRFGLGAFAQALEAVFQRATGGNSLDAIFYGKPLPAPFRWIERVLEDQARAMGLPGSTAPARYGGGSCAFDSIFMVGDNPQVDVRGATAAKAAGHHPWTSILVRTGVFQGLARNCPVDPADIVVDNVDDAIIAAIHRLRNDTWHRMR